MEQNMHLPEDLKPVIDFHGHFCPGVLIGWRASKLALKLLGVGRDRDEELVAITENDACGVDAVQYVLGCTFGKGNLVFRDYGKQAFTVFRRQGRPPRAQIPRTRTDPRGVSPPSARRERRGPLFRRRTERADAGARRDPHVGLLRRLRRACDGDADTHNGGRQTPVRAVRGARLKCTANVYEQCRFALHHAPGNIVCV